MSKKVLEWEVRCLTENLYKKVLLYEEDGEPLKCPSNTEHTLDLSVSKVIDIIEETEVNIKEEIVKTGGHFQNNTMKINALANSTTVHKRYFPFDITALQVMFSTNESHRGDVIDVSAGRNTIIGVLTNNVTPSVITWENQNYTSGQIVTYNHPSCGNRIYTCILNTISNNVPTNETYWKAGYCLNVSPTVVQYAEKGHYINLYTGLLSENVGRIISIDKINNKIYVENNLTNSFNAGTTYIRFTIYMIKDYEFDEPSSHSIGSSKIGGANVPKDILITIEYKNNSNYDKIFISRTELLY